MDYPVERIRSDFPILSSMVNGRPLIYLDNAATTHKPACVTERIVQYYESENSNIHRGAHFLSNKATEAYEEARRFVQMFINAPQASQIVFTRGTTESVNLVAHSFCKKFVDRGDEIILTAMEHHSNIVPWQLAAQEKHATIRVIPVLENGELDLEAFSGMISEKTRIIALAHISNALGTINPVKEIIAIAHKHNIPVLLDGAQAAPHLRIDVQDLDCDFYCISGHKVYGPMGIGILYGKEEWLEQMPPYQGGGEMIRDVSFVRTTYNDLPFKFEAGTPNVSGVLGLEAALKYIRQLGHEKIAAYENMLLDYTISKLSAIENFRLIGTPKTRAGVVSFLFSDIHPYDTGTILDKLGIAVRTGHHCAQPLMDALNIPGTVRVSLAMYNTKNEIDILAEALHTVRDMFA